MPKSPPPPGSSPGVPAYRPVADSTSAVTKAAPAKAKPVAQQGRDVVAQSQAPFSQVKSKSSKGV